MANETQLFQGLKRVAESKTASDNGVFYTVDENLVEVLIQKNIDEKTEMGMRVTFAIDRFKEIEFNTEFYEVLEHNQKQFKPRFFETLRNSGPEAALSALEKAMQTVMYQQKISNDKIAELQKQKQDMKILQAFLMKFSKTISACEFDYKRFRRNVYTDFVHSNTSSEILITGVMLRISTLFDDWVRLDISLNKNKLTFNLNTNSLNDFSEVDDFLNENILSLVELKDSELKSFICKLCSKIENNL